MRPQKERWVKCKPEERCFRPQNRRAELLQGVCLTIDEFEAVRLCDVELLRHDEAAKRMKISRPTLSRIIKRARGKIDDALVNIKAIKIEGGCCKFGKGKI